MKLVLYDANGVIDIFDNLSGVSVRDNSVYWGNGRVEGISASFILLDDSVNISIGDQVTSEIEALDKKASLKQYLSHDELIAENEDLKKKLAKAEEDNITALLALTEVYEQLLALQTPK